MKKNDAKQNNLNDKELNSLNDSLGSFGLEPPKRRNRQINAETFTEPVKSRVNKKDLAPKTRSEIRIEEDKKRESEFSLSLLFLAKHGLLMLFQP